MCFLNAPSGVVAYSITDTMGNVTNKVIVVLNPTRQQQTVSIPEGHYTIVCASGVIDLNGIDTFTGRQVSVAPQTALIIHD
jgi:pullulanase